MECFNPRSREGNDEYNEYTAQLNVVSIHVPARETTAAVIATLWNTNVSIHVPARETTQTIRACLEFAFVSIHVPARETTSIKIALAFLCKFQSTFPRGKRRCKTIGAPLYLVVSIHVPARETTARRNSYTAYCKRFNPRSREGNDGCYFYTHFSYKCFNPRSREGNDVLQFLLESPEAVSIHVPARETTTLWELHLRTILVSIHVPARETTAL